MRYRYDDTGRVVEQLNPAGLSYRYLYEQDRITVTDSLNRREVLHTEGGAGLKRVVKKELADGRGGTADRVRSECGVRRYHGHHHTGRAGDEILL
ncbi:protein in rhs element [Shigella sonnei]|nr:protein in rhs element [Shigella sonnei]